jgi:hypothetical protein
MKYTLNNMIKAYKENEDLINAYINKKPIEKYSSDSNNTIMGLSMGIFLILLVLNLVIFIYALVILYKNWNKLSSSSKIVGVLGLLFGWFGFPLLGPIITIIVVKNN